MRLMQLTEKQARSIELCRTHRITLYDGSIRSGKTINSLIAWLDFLQKEKPKGLLLISGYSKETIKANILEPLLEILGPKRIRWNDDAAFILGFKHAIVGANTVRAEGRIRGRTLFGALVDEVTLIDQGFWSQLLGRLSEDGARVIGTTNPGSPAHWLLKHYLDRARTTIDRNGVETDHAVRTEITEAGATRYYDKNNRLLLNLARFMYTLMDNPALNPEYVESIKAENVGVWYRRNILGEWCIAEGAIYDRFDPIVGGPHVIADTALPRYSDGRVLLGHWTLGIDHGYVNPFHAVLLGFDRVGRVYACREFRYSSREQSGGRQLTDAEYSQRLAKWVDQGCDGVFGEGMMTLRQMSVYLDSAAVGFRTQLSRDGHGFTMDVDKSVIAGIGDVASLINAGVYLTSEKCEHLIRERSGYTWDPKAQMLGQDSPIKLEDHGVDAERYAIRKTRNLWGAALAAGVSGRLDELPKAG